MDENYSNRLRINNQMTVSANCLVGDVNFGTVPADAYTDYLIIGEGRINLGGDLRGYIDVDENLTKDHNFTLTINITGSLSIIEDI